VQYVAAASQKFTCPLVTAAAPVFTVAVNVITLPDSTVVTVPPPDVATRVVVSVDTTKAHSVPPQKIIARIVEKHDIKRNLLTFMVNLHSCLR
jgi:hypothetical protein